MALLDPIRGPQRCGLGHFPCDQHGPDKPDLDKLPGLDATPAAGVCYFGEVAPRLWQTPKDSRWLCRRHLRHALKVGGYPLPIDE